MIDGPLPEDATPGPTPTPTPDPTPTPTPGPGSAPGPTPDQLRTAMDTTPGDSPLLPRGYEDLLNDGITDQISRRSHRRPVVIGALVILIAFTLCLTGIVGTLGYTYVKALSPENVAKLSAVQLHEQISKLPLVLTEASPTKLASKDSVGKVDKGLKSDDTKKEKELLAVKDGGTIKIDAKIYGEVRDSMVPLVALVSILTVAIVVILGTMLKAAFSPHPNHRSELLDKDEVSPVPLLEALKALIESVKAAWK